MILKTEMTDDFVSMHTIVFDDVAKLSRRNDTIASKNKSILSSRAATLKFKKHDSNSGRRGTISPSADSHLDYLPEPKLSYSPNYTPVQVTLGSDESSVGERQQASDNLLVDEDDLSTV